MTASQPKDLKIGFALAVNQLHSAVANEHRLKSAMPHSNPKFEARPGAKFGQNWCVFVTWPSGKTQELCGFDTQHLALMWIKNQSANWTVEQIMRDDT
jgi:hypothetical protein